MPARETASAKLKERGWPFERFSAVDGRKFYGEEMDTAAVAASADTHGIKQLVAEERGNFLSYRALFRHIAESNISRAVVVEDDLEFLENADTSRAAMGGYMRQLDRFDKNWDIVWLTWYPVRDLQSLSLAFPEFPELFTNYTSESLMQDREVDLPNIVKTGPSVGLWAFAVSNSGARKIADFFGTQYAETDMQIARMNEAFSRNFIDPCSEVASTLPEMNMYGFRPQLFKAHSTMDMLNILGKSTIGAKRFLVHHRDNDACTVLKNKAKNK